MKIKLTQKNILLLILSTLLYSCDNRNDFDTVCNYFDDLERQLSTLEITKDQKFSFINERIVKNLPTDSTARESWNAVMGFAQVEGRYALFKDAAEVTLHESWQCLSMKKLLKTI